MVYGSYNSAWGSYNDYQDKNLEDETKTPEPPSEYQQDYDSIKNSARDNAAAFSTGQCHTKRIESFVAQTILTITEGQNHFRPPSNNLPEEVEIDKDNWAVNMISDKCGWYGHAMILVRGIDEEGNFFKTVMDLMPGGGKQPDIGVQIDDPKTSVGVVKVEDIEDVSLYCKHSSEAWVRPAWKVREMIQKAQREENGTEPVFFNIDAHTTRCSDVKGKTFKDLNSKYMNVENVIHSEKMPHQFSWTKENGVEDIRIKREVFTPDNCISWVARKLQMVDVVIPLKTGGMIQSLPTFMAKKLTQEHLKEDEPKVTRPYNPPVTDHFPDSRAGQVNKEYYKQESDGTICVIQ